MAVVHVSGFEHGLMSTAGGGLAQSNSSAATIQSTTKNHGTYALRINAAAASARLQVPTDVVQTGQVYGTSFSWLCTTNDVNERTILEWQSSRANTWLGVHRNASGKLVVSILESGGLGTVTYYTTTATIALSTWYTIEFLAKCDANPWTFRLIVRDDTGAIVEDSGTITGPAFAAANFSLLALGVSSTRTVDHYFDNWVIVNAAADFPIGKCDVEYIAPGRDGTHNTSAGTTFIGGDTATTPNFTNSTTTAFQLVDDAPPWTGTRSTTDNISAEVHVAGAYMEVKPSTSAARVGETAVGMRALLAYSSPTATANLASCESVNADGTVQTIYGVINGTGQSYGVSSNNFKGVTVTKPAAGFTEANIEATAIRMGLPSGAGDVAPRPTWQIVGWEIAYPVVSAPPIDGAATITSSFTLTQSGVIEKVGAVTITSTFTSTQSGVLEKVGSATITSTFTSTQSGIAEKVGAATIPFTFTVSADWRQTINGAATISSSFSLAQSGVVEKVGAATITSAFTVTSSAVRERVGSATITSTYTVTSSAIREKVAAATIGSTFTVSTTAVREQLGSATITSTYTVAASGQRTANASSTITFATTIFAAGEILGGPIDGIATITMAFAVSAAGQLTANAAASISTTFSVAVSGTREKLAAATITSSYSVTTVGRREAVGSLSVPVAFTVAASAKRDAVGAAAISFSYTITAFGRTDAIDGEATISVTFAVASAAQVQHVSQLHRTQVNWISITQFTSPRGARSSGRDVPEADQGADPQYPTDTYPPRAQGASR